MRPHQTAVHRDESPSGAGSGPFWAVGAAVLQANSLAISGLVIHARSLGHAIGLKSAAQALGLRAGRSVGGYCWRRAGALRLMRLRVPSGGPGQTDFQPEERPLNKPIREASDHQGGDELDHEAVEVQMSLRQVECQHHDDYREVPQVDPVGSLADPLQRPPLQDPARPAGGLGDQAGQKGNAPVDGNGLPQTRRVQGRLPGDDRDGQDERPGDRQSVRTPRIAGHAFH